MKVLDKCAGIAQSYQERTRAASADVFLVFLLLT